MTKKSTGPIAIKFVSACSLLFGFLLVLPSMGSIVAQYATMGGVVEYGAVIQLLLGGLLAGSAIFLFRASRKARDVLEITLWLTLVVSVLWVLGVEAEFRGMVLVSVLLVWGVIGLLLYGIRTETVRSYVNGGELDD